MFDATNITRECWLAPDGQWYYVHYGCHEDVAGEILRTHPELIDEINERKLYPEDVEMMNTDSIRETDSGWWHSCYDALMRLGWIHVGCFYGRITWPECTEAQRHALQCHWERFGDPTLLYYMMRGNPQYSTFDYIRASMSNLIYFDLAA